MRKKLCPKCRIHSLYIKNEKGDILPIIVYIDNSIAPKHSKDSLEGFNLDIIFCFGCSWSGKIKELI